MVKWVISILRMGFERIWKTGKLVDYKVNNKQDTNNGTGNNR